MNLQLGHQMIVVGIHRNRNVRFCRGIFWAITVHPQSNLAIEIQDDTPQLRPLTLINGINTPAPKVTLW